MKEPEKKETPSGTFNSTPHLSELLRRENNSEHHFLEAQGYLARQCELLTFISAIFGLYDFAFYFFSFIVDPSDIAAVLLPRYCLLIPLLALLRSVIRRSPHKAAYIDAIGGLIVAIPSVTAILMVSLAPKYVVPCSAVSVNPSCDQFYPPAAPPHPPLTPGTNVSEYNAQLAFSALDSPDAPSVKSA